MLCLFPNSAVLINSLRIFGHFPYTWTSKSNLEKIENSNLIFIPKNTMSIRENDTCVFVPSKFWKIWSIGFCIINTLITIYCTVEENHLIDGRTYGIDTVRAAYTIYDCLFFFTLCFMNIYSIKNSYKLNKILNKLHAFLSATEIDIKRNWFIDFSWIAPYLVLIACFGLLLIVWVVQFSVFRNVYHFCFYNFITAVSVLLVAIYSSIFHGILSTVGSLYEVVFSNFTIYSKNIENEYCNSPLQVCCNKRKTVASVNTFVIGSGYNSDMKENSLEREKIDKMSRKKITIDTIRNCKVSLLQLFSYKRLIVDFFQVLIIIFMMELIASTIIPLFYISILNRNYKEILIPIFHSIPNIISLLVLLNAPYKIKHQVCL